MIALLILAILERISKFTLVLWFFRKHQIVSTTDRSHLEVSILQPILSGDPTLWDCLRANLRSRTSYKIEWIWLVDDNDYEGIKGCKQLIEEFTNLNIQLILLPPPADGVNPKTLKLITGEKIASGRVIVVLDDDTRIPDDGLDLCLPYLNEPGVGLVFGLPYYQNFTNIWSSLISSFVNANSLLLYVPYTFLVDPFTINGMFYAIARPVLAAVNGFNGLENQLCDDYAVANRIRTSGYKLKQTPLCHAISTTVPSFTAYMQLLNRWLIFPQVSIMSTTKLSELVIFYIMVVIPNFFPLATIIIGAAIPTLLPLVLLYWLVNVTIVFAINRHFFRRVSILLLFMQVIIPLHIIRALLSPKEFIWRGHKIRVLPNNQIHYVRRKGEIA